MPAYKELKIENPHPSNRIEVLETKKTRGLIRFIGESNTVVIDSGVTLNAEIRLEGHGNKVYIGKGCAVRGQILVKGNNQNVYIGSYTTFQSVYILCQEGCNVHIGRHCMFSRNVEIRTTDAHSVVDLDTLKRINIASSITIGEHVWIGVGVLVSKGSFIPDDCVVGANSFVNGKFEKPNVVLAGCPAKVVKDNITWNRSRKSTFKPDEVFAWKEPE